MKRALILTLSMLGTGLLLGGCSSPDIICNTGKPSAQEAMDHLIDATLAGNQIEVCRVTTTGGTDTVDEQFEHLAQEFKDLDVAAGFTATPIPNSTLGEWSQLKLVTPSHPEGKSFDVFQRSGNYTIGWLEFPQDPLPTPAK